MRIGILSQWFPPETGPATIPGVLARELARRGHQVRVLTGLPNYPTGQLYPGYRVGVRDTRVGAGVRVRRVLLVPDHSDRWRGRLLNYGSFAASATLAAGSFFLGADVLWVYNSPATIALPMWLARMRNRMPVVLHNMDMWPDSVLNSGYVPRVGGDLFTTALSRWVDMMYRSARIVAYLTPSAGEELERRGVPRRKLRYGPVWIDEDIFRPASAPQLRAELGYADGDVVVGYAGSMGRAQAALTLATSLSRLPTNSRVRGLFLGSGPEAEAVERLATHYPARITFLGHIPHQKMTEFAAVPDICFVGISDEGHALFSSPSKVQAIMATARPVLAAAQGDIASLVEAAGAGYVVPPDDPEALFRALSGLEERRQELTELGLAARRFFDEQFQTRVAIDRIETMLLDAARP